MPEYAPLEAILRLCAASAPVPWYPRHGASTLGMNEPDLIAFVEQLRNGGLIARTDAVAGYGRGYVLTPLGVQALRDPGDLEWLRRGEIPPHKIPPASLDPCASAPAGSERERAVRMSLLAPFTPRVTQALIAINVAVFLWGVYLAHRPGGNLGRFLTGLPEAAAHRTGAIEASDVMQPGWGLLRLLTCCFVHFGLVHLGANMLSLYFIGPTLERMWGHARFLVLYLVAGFGGSCAAVVLHPVGGNGTEVMLAGASGAIWGIMASMAVWFLLNRRYLPRRMFWSSAKQILFVVLINVGITYMGSGFISAEAHYGGGLVGALCAVFLHFTRFTPAVVRAVAMAAVAALPIAGLNSVTHPGRYNPQWDHLQWHARYLPPAQNAIKESNDLVNHSPASLLLRQDPQDRDDEKRKEVLAKYDEAIAKLRPALDLLPAEPFHEPKVEEARQVGRSLVEARLELWTWQQLALKDGEAPLKEKKYRDLEERVKELADQWRLVQEAR
jgi:membrane associated rhomboid family serine protease